MALQVIDKELFNKIRKDFKRDSFEQVQERYEMEENLLKDILLAESYEKFCEDKGL